MATHELGEETRAARLLDAQEKAAQLFEAVGRAGILPAGVSDSVASDGSQAWIHTYARSGIRPRIARYLHERVR
jgi:hypothetical protein